MVEAPVRLTAVMLRAREHWGMEERLTVLVPGPQLGGLVMRLVLHREQSMWHHLLAVLCLEAG